LRLCGDQGDLIRARLAPREGNETPDPAIAGTALHATRRRALLAEAAKLRSKNMYPALVVDLNCGLRDKELRELGGSRSIWSTRGPSRWASRNQPPARARDPAERSVMIALEAHAAWYSADSVHASPAGTSSPPARGSRTTPPAQLRRSGRRGRRCARTRRSLDGGTTTATPWFTELADPGRRTGGDHEHRRARLARHALALLPRPDGGERHASTRSPHASATADEKAQGRMPNDSSRLPRPFNSRQSSDRHPRRKPVLRGATSSWIPFTGCLAVKMCCIFKRLARLWSCGTGLWG